MLFRSVVRSVTGEVQSYPVVETVHKNSICHLVFAPAQVGRGLTGTSDETFSTSIQERARKVAENAVASLSGAGVFGVEMFLMKDGKESKKEDSRFFFFLRICRRHKAHSLMSFFFLGV